MFRPNSILSNDSRQITFLARYDYSVLSPRGLLGYKYEVSVQWNLDKNGIRHKGNPLNPTDWNKVQRVGADKLIHAGNVDVDAECKFHSATSRPIFPCDIQESYLPRFMNPSHVKVVVTNDKSFYTESSVRLLTDNGILVMTDDELIAFCLRLEDTQYDSTPMTVGSILSYVGSISNNVLSKSNDVIVTNLCGIVNSCIVNNSSVQGSAINGSISYSFSNVGDDMLCHVKNK